MNDQRNLILAVVLSVLIMVGFQAMMPAPTPAPSTPAPAADTAVPPAPSPSSAEAPAAAPAAVAVASRETALTKSARIPISTPALSGSIALAGARLDDLTLTRYGETPSPDSARIGLFSPAGSPQPYFAEFGWVPADPAVRTPGADSQWRPLRPGATLEAGGEVALTWDNGDGLRFVRTIGLDQDYMFSVRQRVENYGTKAVTLHAYALVARTGTPATSGMYILHEGPLGVFDGTLKEIDYEDLQKEGSIRVKSTGGWIGITDKYWLAALIPDQKKAIGGRFVHQRAETGERYQVDTLGEARTLEPGAALEETTHLFAGAKRVSLLDGYAETLGIERFDLAIDFGWFYFLTKPFFYILQTFHLWLGNMGLAIMALTVLIKLALFPLANKSYRSMSAMKKLQPEVQKLQARFPDDRTRLQQEMMALYKKEKVNPVSGCLPILVQIPIFFALYKVLFVTIEMRHAPFYGWIKDLSAPDPTTLFNLFGLIPWEPPSFLMIGVWPLVMGITMYLQQKLNPAPADPVQAKMFQFLPFVFTFMLAPFAAGLVIYWAWSNSLSILQQWVIMRQAGVKP